MKRFDFGLQSAVLLAYVIISPLLFGILYPTTGDVSLIWIWVVIITGITGIISLVLFTLLNLVVKPEETYKFKGILPILLSSLLSTVIGEAPSKEIAEVFFVANASLLLGLYFAYTLVFLNKI